MTTAVHCENMSPFHKGQTGYLKGVKKPKDEDLNDENSFYFNANTNNESPDIKASVDERDDLASPLPRDRSLRNSPADFDHFEDETLGSKIFKLKGQIMTLRASSVAFRESMEAVLSTIQGISQANSHRTDGYFDLDNKTLPQFRNASGRKLITGVASRIERSNMKNINGKLSYDDRSSFTTSCPATPLEGRHKTIVSIAVPSIYSFQNKERVPSEQDSFVISTKSDNNDDLIKQELTDKEVGLVSKRQLKVTEGVRPTSDSFVINNTESTQDENSLPDDQKTNSLPLAQVKDKSAPIKGTSFLANHSGSKNVLDNGFRASETSIDSGYHGGSGNTSRGSAHGRVCSPASPLSKIYDSCETNEEDLSINNRKNVCNKPIPPNSLPLDSTQVPCQEMPCSPIESIRTDSKLSNQLNEAISAADDTSVDLQSPPSLPPKNSKCGMKISKNEINLKPRVPRSSKRIKMGVSSVVTSPLPKARTIFTAENQSVENHTSVQDAPCNKESELKKTIKSETNNEQKVVKTSDSTTEDEESSVLRRRSMRMMTEFKLFDFSDSTVGIESSVKSPKQVSKKKHSESKQTTKESKKNIPLSPRIPVKTQVVTKVPQSVPNTKLKPRRSSLKSSSKRKEVFSDERLPTPPLPPPPPSPPLDSPEPLPKIQFPEFKEFTSLARDKTHQFHLQSNAPVSSPKCVRKKLNDMNEKHSSPLLSSSQTPAITASNKSAFTPVSTGTWSDVSLDDLSTCGRGNNHNEPIKDVCNNNNNLKTREEVALQKPKPVYPRMYSNETKPTTEQPAFRRQNSLPLTSISNRSKHRQHMEANNKASVSNLANRFENGNTKEPLLRRGQSMRVHRSKRYDNDLISPTSGQEKNCDLENQPIQFNRDEKMSNVVNALHEAGFLQDAPWLANVGQNSHPNKKSENFVSSTEPNTPMLSRSAGLPVYKQKSSVKERREESFGSVTSCNQQPERSSRGKSTIDIIRASFRGRRGKSLPATSSTNASHEFSTGVPLCNQPKSPISKREEQSAPPPLSRQNSKNKVRQRLDQKPVTPVPSVAKARRRKQSADSKVTGNSFYEKLRNAARIQQVNNNKKIPLSQKHSEKTENENVSRRRYPSEASERSFSSHLSGQSRTCESYPTGSLASNASVGSYSSNASHPNSKAKKSTFV